MVVSECGGNGWNCELDRDAATSTPVVKLNLGGRSTGMDWVAVSVSSENMVVEESSSPDVMLETPVEMDSVVIEGTLMLNDGGVNGGGVRSPPCCCCTH